MGKNDHRGRSINELSKVLLDWLTEQSYSADSLNSHRQVANQVGNYMLINGIDKYTTAVGDEFLDNYFSERNVCYQHGTQMKMIVSRLNDCNEGKTPALRRNTHTGRASLTDQFATIFERYLEWCETHGSKASTIRAKSKYCGDFFLYLADFGCKVAEDMTSAQICNACLMFDNKNAWSHVRMLLRYLYENCYVDRDYSALVPHYRRPFVMPSVYTEEEICGLEAVVDRTGKTGIRDYAMLLLVTRYGLRTGDITKLVFNELDFQGERIRLTQEKTGQPWEVKMVPEVRDALLDYIHNARPNVDSDTVFLLTRAPYRGIDISSLGDAIKRYLPMAYIDAGDRKRGPHALRSSLASSMVNDNVPYEVVRRVLGHIDPNAVKHYAKIDIERLREYSIPIPEPTGLFAHFLSGEVRI